MSKTLHNITSRLWPVDRITILYIFITALLLAFGTGIYDDVLPHYFMRAGMLLFILLVITIEKKRPGELIRNLHQLYPLVFLGYFFSETYYLSSLFRPEMEPVLIRWEMKIFGTMSGIDFSNLFTYSWFSELMHFGYFSFYLIMLSFIVFYYNRLPELAGRRIFVFLFSFYLFYLIFILFTSEGPYYFLSVSESHVPEGYFFSWLMHKILILGDKPTGAFPSSHIGITWMIMMFFFIDKRKLFYLWLIPAVLLTFSTVYIKAHYAVDVLAGFVTVPLFVFTGNKIYDIFFDADSWKGKKPYMTKTQQP